MKVKQLIEKLQKQDPEADLMLFKRDIKRPHLSSGTIIPIKDIGVLKSIDQDTNESILALEIKKDE